MLIFIVIGYLAYTYFSGKNLTEDERQLKLMEKDFNAALQQYQMYVRMSGASGMDITYEVSDIVEKVKRLREDLFELKKQLSAESDLEKANELEERMTKFMEGIR